MKRGMRSKGGSIMKENINKRAVSVIIVTIVMFIAVNLPLPEAFLHTRAAFAQGPFQVITTDANQDGVVDSANLYMPGCNTLFGGLGVICELSNFVYFNCPPGDTCEIPLSFVPPGFDYGDLWLAMWCYDPTLSFDCQILKLGPTPPPPPIVGEGRIVAWARTRNDVTVKPVPAGDSYVQISAGGAHSVALRADGSLVGWGSNQLGQLNVPSGIDFVQVAAGERHNIAIRADGSLVGWGGLNEYGQATVPEGNDFVQVAASMFQSLAIRTDGSLVQWGLEWGELPAGNDYVQVAAGIYHNLALRADGSLVGWGDTTVPEGNDFVQISAGFHSLALRADGSLVGWGDTTVPSGNDFIQIATNLDHKLALRTDGSLVGWGGDLEPATNDVPPGNVFTKIAAGWGHNVALSTVPPREAGPLTIWIGLKNSDDQGTQFDLMAELYKNDVPISRGKTLCITGVTRNPSLARETSVEFGPVFTKDLAPEDTLSLKVFTRIGTTPDGMKCSGPGGSHNNAVGLRAYYDAPTRPSRFSADIPPYSLLTDLFLHSSGTNYFFNDVSPTGTMKYKDSGSVNFKNGNPWKEIGTWSMPVQ